MARSRLPATYRQDDLFGAAPLPLLTSVVELNGDLEEHAHDFLEVAVVSAGNGTHVTAAGSTEARSGAVFVLRPGAWHGFTGCHGLVIANCCVGTSGPVDELAFLHGVPELRRLLWTAPVTGGRRGVLATSVSLDAAAGAIAEIRRLTEILQQCVCNRVMLISGLLAVLGNLVQDAVPVEPTTMSRPAAVETVVRALESAPEQPWTVDGLAALVNLDPAYLSRLFKLHVGLPPIGYLARVRIERASVLLSHTDVPVAHVGAEVGWPDPNYFARRFRTLLGLTPTAYRARSLSSPTETHPVGARGLSTRSWTTGSRAPA